MAQPIEPTPVLEGRDAEQFWESVKVNEPVYDRQRWMDNLVQQSRTAEQNRLVAGITPQNRHGEQDWGKRVGNEVW
jgi:antitoxin component of MazEF toxin-antitoxin module